MKNQNNNQVIANPMQFQRIKKSKVQYPVGSYLIDDNLEMGHIRIFETMDRTLVIQMLEDFKMKEKHICSEIVLNDMFNTSEAITEDEKLWIHSIQCNFGEEQWIAPMLEAIFDFADFYGYEEICMNKNTYENYISKDSEVREKFKEVKGIYIMKVNG